ncbi:MAG: NAD-dependent epimerase/dehydratase family protein [Rhodospirillaceae bacterium]|nr:NAD-dependent epimerase/dehydratase family protein [Rhodospirillaceae bacterium]
MRCLALIAALGVMAVHAYAQDARDLWRGVALSGETVVVVGATGRTAQHFIPQALAAGHRIIALTRKPETFKLQNARVRAEAADVYDVESLKKVLTGKEVVVSFLGVPDPDLSKGEVPEVDLYSRGAANMVAAMKARGNRKIVFTTSMGHTITPPQSNPDGSDPRMLYFWNVRHIYEDERRAEAVLRASGLDYIIMRPAFIVQRPSRGHYIARLSEPYPINPIITYPDFAAFAVEQVTAKEFVGKAVGIDDGRVFTLTAKGMSYE